ncbi:MAG: xanthine dehydrogenase molybdopterin binding subunit [Burkholderiales bacterium]|jgi:xanthine dehydrogenase large subunit|nr:xanthine dehydrogenase molybdopterin binding subunit [Burkholderiales bacterium]MCZ8100828.1 xanthine dehydrogenase molybdopterin binding subunit [Burkholderiales bacterium]
MNEPMPGFAPSVAHESAALHVTGAARYTDDLPEPAGTLHGAFGVAGLAHARIDAIDLEAVRASPGVVDVLLAADLPGANNYGGIVHDDPLLADRETHYEAQPVLLVLATSHRAARVAARRARVSATPLPAILTVAEAIAASSWVLPPVEVSRGDPARALAAAPRVLEGRSAVGGQDHFYLEGQVSLAVPQDDGGVVVHASTQHPTEVQHVVADALGVPGAWVRVECRRMGGGFGGKESQPALLAALAAVAARRTGRAVKIRLDRDDDMTITGKRHPFEADWRVGFDDDGRILALDVTLASDCGYSADLSGPVNDRAVCHVDNAYWLPNLRIRSLRCRTNKVSNTAFRGFGGPQGMFVIEEVVDAVARATGLDALAVRRVNLYGVDARNETHYGQVIRDNVLPVLLDQLEASSRYAARRTEVDAFNARGGFVRRGLALTPVKFGISFNAVHLNQAGALLHLYADGSLLLNHGGTEMGQGLFTKVAQVVAREFDVDVARVRVSATDTARVPNTSATAASSGSDLNGMAAREACLALKTRLAAFLAGAWSVPADAVRWHDGAAHAAVDGVARSIALADLARRAYMARVSLSAQGYYRTPDIHWDGAAFRGQPFYYFAYGAAVVEVAVDTLTGEHRMLAVDLLHDVGTSLNPAIDLGQIEGGFVQGVGWLTGEELVWDARGRLVTHAPSTYKIPTAGDVPTRWRVALLADSPNRSPTIHRSKAVGEPPLMLALAAYHALRDAVASLAPAAARVALQAPATPEAVLRAVRAARVR